MPAVEIRPAHSRRELRAFVKFPWRIYRGDRNWNLTNVEDLLADSIRLVELMSRLEDHGIQIPLEAAWEIRTVGDAYRLYREQCAFSRLGSL